ncbi:protein-glutamate O-methyltransferase CheR [Skermanella sp. TT6]|uniref:protein-glutamate O-methyltransferase n=1 Tax=Skermanella cutis TaxID=2775420 RepID=A0ABX7BDC7_9PROT|nr:protein-glutamate O-methyltransferase CheR [Skermanella sp. TT6]QQP91745.1 protein-glutamate O-methyltransferase CheR [Skermanella sp. TT6]
MPADKPDQPGSPDIRIADHEFRRFRDFLYRRTGIVFGDAQRAYVERRLADRILAAGSRGFSEHFARLLVEPDEMERLISAFTVNETYFYREDYQLRCLTSTLLDRITARKRRGQPIRLWSVPCSTGEEPYSIAIWLLENWPHVDSWDIEIVGSDIDVRALDAAQEGVYSERSLMRLSRPLVAKYFTALDGGRYRIDEALRGSVRFSQVNIIDQGDTGLWRDMDVIFCRNVLIYFDDMARRTAASNLYDSLAPGGYICLGHTESMSRISPLFHVCRFPEAIVYQKPGEGGHD